MKTGYTHMGLLLDASSSMNSIKRSIIEGFNEYVDEQRNGPGTATVTLAQFSSARNFKYIYNMVDVKEVQPLTNESYVVSGMTALTDALGRLINDTGRTLAAMSEEERPDGVMIIVMSDGDENDSKEFTQAKVKEMISHQESKYNWKFIYIGANQDSYKVKGTYNMTAAMNFSADAESVGKMFKKMSTSNTMYRSRGVVGETAYLDALVDDQVSQAASGNQIFRTTAMDKTQYDALTANSLTATSTVDASRLQALQNALTTDLRKSQGANTGDSSTG